jgi:hypothetical protein
MAALKSESYNLCKMPWKQVDPYLISPLSFVQSSLPANPQENSFSKLKFTLFE